jgi:hypothetical protein
MVCWLLPFQAGIVKQFQREANATPAEKLKGGR